MLLLSPSGASTSAGASARWFHGPEAMSVINHLLERAQMAVDSHYPRIPWA